MKHLPENWLGQWISPDESGTPARERPAYRLRGRFIVAEHVEHAQLFAAALGVYEIFLNGRRVGDVELAPGSTNYDATLYAQSYEVTDLVTRGENEVEIVLSDGWYRGRNGSERARDRWGSVTAALAQLEVRMRGGASTILATDGSWTSRRSCIVAADLMDGQTTDFSLPEQPETPVLIERVTPPAPTTSPAPAVRRIQEVPATRSWTEEDAVTIVDFGQNISGWIRLSDLGSPGSTTTIEMGEHTDSQGRLSTSYLDVHSPQGEHIPFSQVDRVTAGHGDDIFEPRHTIHGFRYARITHPGRDLDPAQLTAIVVHTDLDRTGWFEGDDDRLVRLHEAARWTFRGNAVDVPTDCPTRERAGWTGDFQVFAPTAARLFDISGFASKWLAAVRDDQYDDGCLAMFSPDHLRMKHSQELARIGGGSAGWGDAAVAVPWTVYQHYGDRRVLEESWESASAWVDYALTCARTQRHSSRSGRSEIALRHEKYIWDAPFHFGEWLEWNGISSSDVDPAVAYAALFTSDKGEVGTAYLYRSCSQLAEIADVLGRTDDASRLRTTAEHILSAWRREFLRADGRTVLDTQAAYVRAIAFGLIPEQGVAPAAERLVELIEAADRHLATGFLSTGMLLPVLADTGYVDLAYELLTRTGVPSWLEMLDRGGTTFWENWDNVDENGDARPGSLNHYSKGAVVGFLYSHIAGIRQAPDSAGWRRFVVAPVIGGALTRASTTQVTPHGRIVSEWSRTRDEITLRVFVPEASSGTAQLPGQQPVALSSGQWTTVSAPAPPGSINAPAARSEGHLT